MSAVPWHDDEKTYQRRRMRQIGIKAVFTIGTVAAYAYAFWVVLAYWPAQ